MFRVAFSVVVAHCEKYQIIQFLNQNSRSVFIAVFIVYKYFQVCRLSKLQLIFPVPSLIE